jgi:hypothetical protein
VKGRVQLWLFPALVLGCGLYGLQLFYARVAVMPWKPQRIGSTLGAIPTNAKSESSDSAFQIAVVADTMPPQSPFRLASPPRPTYKNPSLPTVTWTRPTVILKGTVGTQAATLISPQGEKKILRVGEYMDSILVVRIQPGRVTLRDSHGTFDIISQE